MHADDRPLHILRAIYAHGKDRRTWPDLDQLRRFRPALGCRTTVYRTLTRLRELELLVILGAGHARRWALTERAYDLLKRPTIVPALEIQRARHDAATLLGTTPSVPPILSRRRMATPQTVANALRDYETLG